MDIESLLEHYRNCMRYLEAGHNNDNVRLLAAALQTYLVGVANLEEKRVALEEVQAEKGAPEGQQKGTETERQHSIRLHLQLLDHVVKCRSCASPNCIKFKRMLQHLSLCSISLEGGCKECRKVWAMLHIHARNCSSSTCKTPHCRRIKKIIREKLNLEVLEAEIENAERECDVFYDKLEDAIEQNTMEVMAMELTVL